MRTACASPAHIRRLGSPRYAWVLAGVYPPPGMSDAPAPRSEFQVFQTSFGAELISLSSLDDGGPRRSKLLRRYGSPRMGLAEMVLSRAEKFDAILASGEDIGIPLALMSLVCRSRVPIHMMFHGHHLESRKLRWLAPLLRQLGHVHFHCLSESLRVRTQSVLGIPDERCHATGYGVDTEYFGGAPFSPNGPIASAGAANRDYATLAAAARGVAVDHRIAADSTWVPVALDEAPLRWPAHVDIRSYGDYAGLRELYRQARFVVVPMHPAGHACGYAVIAEAMAMGRAVIATRTDVPPDFLVPGHNSLFAEPHDVQGLRSRILHLIDNPAEVAEMGRNARAVMAAGHGLETYCARLERLVARSIAAPGRSADLVRVRFR